MIASPLPIETNAVFFSCFFLRELRRNTQMILAADMA
jgi:hypothetical protein